MFGVGQLPWPGANEEPKLCFSPVLALREGSAISYPWLDVYVSQYEERSSLHLHFFARHFWLFSVVPLIALGWEGCNVDRSNLRNDTVLVGGTVVVTFVTSFPVAADALGRGERCVLAWVLNDPSKVAGCIVCSAARQYRCT